MATTPASAPQDAAPAADALCPRCQKPLTDPAGLGWCQACGYCRSLGEDLKHVPAPGAKTDAVALPPALAPGPFPVWIIGLLIGVVVLAAGTWVVNHFVQLRPLHRALWATIQIGVGMLVMMVGQCYALFKIAPEEGSLYFTDAVVPFRLYGMVFKRLPRMAAALYFGSWGLVLIVSALIFVGGLGHWITYLPKSSTSTNRGR